MTGFLAFFHNFTDTSPNSVILIEFVPEHKTQNYFFFFFTMLQSAEFWQNCLIWQTDDLSKLKNSANTKIMKISIFLCLLQFQIYIFLMVCYICVTFVTF